MKTTEITAAAAAAAAATIVLLVTSRAAAIVREATRSAAAAATIVLLAMSPRIEAIVHAMSQTVEVAVAATIALPAMSPRIEAIVLPATSRIVRIALPLPHRRQKIAAGTRASPIVTESATEIESEARSAYRVERHTSQRLTTLSTITDVMMWKSTMREVRIVH